MELVTEVTDCAGGGSAARGVGSLAVSVSKITLIYFPDQVAALQADGRHGWTALRDLPLSKCSPPCEQGGS